MIGMQRSHTIAARILSRRNFIAERRRVEVFGKSSHYTVYGGIDFIVRQFVVSNVYESDVYPQSWDKRKILMAQTICLSYSTAHENAVNSTVEPFFRHRNNKCDRSVGTTTRIVSRHSPQRIAEACKRCSAWAEQIFDGPCGAKFFFFI